MYDYHLHTRYSMDSDAPVESVIQAAIDKGVRDLFRLTGCSRI